MNTILYRFGLLLLAFFPLLVFADPIQDGSMNGYKSGWYPNSHEGKLLTCPQTCKVKVGSLAEYEAAPGTIKRTFVCKVPFRPEGRIQTFLFGNQFDTRPACYTVDVSLKGKYSKKYFCLCVKPLRP